MLNIFESNRYIFRVFLFVLKYFFTEYSNTYLNTFQNKYLQFLYVNTYIVLNFMKLSKLQQSYQPLKFLYP